MNPRLLNKMRGWFGAALEIKQVSWNEAAEPYGMELYRCTVPEALERELDELPKRLQKFIRRTSSVTVYLARGYVYSPVLNRPWPEATNRLEIKEDSELYAKILASKTALEAPQAKQRELLAKVIAVAESYKDHRQLWHLWPGVAKYCDSPLGENRTWPKRQKTRTKRQLTDEERVALAEFVLTAKVKT